MRNRGLHTDAHEAVGIVHREPRVRGQSAAAIVGVAVVAHVDPGACIREGLDHVRTSLVRRTVERRIENPLSKRILSGEFKEGDKVLGDYRDGDYLFTKVGSRPAEAPEAEPVGART